MVQTTAQLTCRLATALLLLLVLNPSAEATTRRLLQTAGEAAAAGAAAAIAAGAAAAGAAAGAQQASSLPIYDLVEYIGTSGSTITASNINTFPRAPSNVKLTWVIAFIGDATASQATPSGSFGCTGGSFCSGSNLDQGLITALKGVQTSTGMTKVLAGIGGANYPTWPSSSSSGYADTAAASLVAYAKANNLDGYDLDFEDGLNDDWVTQWTQIVTMLGQAGIPVTIDPFYATTAVYGQLYANLAKASSTGSGVGPQVSGINYQAYAFDSGSSSSEQSVQSAITSGSSSVVSTFGAAQGQKIVFGVAPNRPGPSSSPSFATNCAALGRIVDVVCPALKTGNGDNDNTDHWATGIMVFDFDTEFAAGGFTLVNAAYQALSGKCSSINKC